MRLKYLFIVIVAAVAGLTALSSLQADIFSYDFNSLTVGTALEGQNFWDKFGSDASFTVEDGTGVNTTPGVTTPDGMAHDMRGMPAMSFGSGTLLVLQADVLTGLGRGDVGIGLTAAPGPGAFLPMVGQYASNFHICPRTGAFGDLQDTGYLGSTLTTGHWYQIQLRMDLSTVGGLGSLYYRDLTLGQTTFTADPLLQNKALLLTADTFGKYEFDRMAVRASYGAHIDNYSVFLGTIPEPSTLALCVTGLIGLLAYAWRKRKCVPS